MKGNKLNWGVVLATMIVLSVLAGLGIAGLLTYYGRAVGTATVQQSVKLSDYGSDNQQIQEIDYKGEINFYSEIVAGDELVNGKDSSNNAEIKYFRVKNYASQSSASIIVGIDNDNNNEVDNETNLDAAIESVKFVEYISGSCTDNEIGSGIEEGKVGRRLELEAGGEKDFCIKIKFKINAEPGNYTYTVKVLPA
ncbi:MAG: hypothetical protein QXI09_00210 [Candidatus Aenigmatarchaeota archaeon]